MRRLRFVKPCRETRDRGGGGEESAARSGNAAECDERSYRAGLVIGAVTLVMALGVIKDVWALVKPGGEGALVFGFLMIRYSSLYLVWVGYALTDTAAW